jgi:ribose 5-phosphate isomerase
MIECHLKGFRDTYKARSRVGLGKGSHSTSQRLVEALADTCAKTKRTYGLCTSKGMHMCKAWQANGFAVS